MLFSRPLLPGTLVRRYKRFFADVLLDDGTEVVAHCVNPGSMLGCFSAGWRCWVTPHSDPKRKLQYTLEIIAIGDTLVGVNTALPNALVEEALKDGRIAAVPVKGLLRREFRWTPATRFDFHLQGEDVETLIEVKNVTLAENGCGYFPDSVTERGKKHIEELVAVRASGRRAVLLFWVNRADCTRIRPAEWIDPAYAATLRMGHGAGVEIHAVCARVSPTGIESGPAIPVDLGPMADWDAPPVVAMAASAKKRR